MKKIIAFAAALAVSTTAFAAEDATIKTRTLVKTSDGRRVGTIDRVFKDTAGAATSVQIIYRGRFVVIPASTLTPQDKTLVTSLTTADVNKL